MTLKEMKNNRKLERLIDRLDYASEYTEQVPLISAETKRGWFLFKNGSREWFYTMGEIAEYLGVSYKYVAELRLGRCPSLQSQGWSIMKVEDTLKKC